MGKRILCGRFAEKLKNNFAVGDEDNNLILYNLVGPKPIAVLNPQTNNNVSSLTALTFTQSDDQIVVGHSRGSINVWDLNSLKSIFPAMQSVTVLRDTQSRCVRSTPTENIITSSQVGHQIRMPKFGICELKTARATSKTIIRKSQL